MSRCVSVISELAIIIINRTRNRMATSNEKGKTVQNYILDAIKYVNPDESEIWAARHKILKKTYMLKRIQYAKNSAHKVSTFENDDQLNAFKLKKLSHQIELLKQLKISGTPKCQKMIKTSNSVYVVYDQFPGVSLRELVKAENLSQEQRLKIMINLSKTLLNYHLLCINFLLLSPDTIFQLQNQSLFFSEWGSAIYKNQSASVFPFIASRASEFVANEVVEEGRFTTASDIFSLGKIFNHLADKNASQANNESDSIELTTLIDKMTDRNDLKRPPLQDVIERLENILKNYPKTSELTHSKGVFKSKLERKSTLTTLYARESSLSQEKSNDKKNQASPSNLREKQVQESRQIKNSRLTPTFSFDNILIGMSRTISRPSLSRIKKSSEAFMRKINKARNLSYFIIELSDFALKWAEGEVLGYLLLKHSYLTLNSCYSEWNNEDFQDKRSVSVTDILKEEIVQLNLSLNMLKEYLMPQRHDNQFKTQLRNDLAINEKYYKQKTVSFCRNLLDQLNASIKENKVKSLSGLVDNLFSIYMILKRLEEGSYEKYWDKIYCSEYAFLRSQKYFEEEKKLGYRYLRSKISEVLSKK